MVLLSDCQHSIHVEQLVELAHFEKEDGVEMSRLQFNQMRLKKSIRQAKILIQFKRRMKQLSKKAQWNALVKSLKSLYLVFILRINPLISSQ